MKANITILHDPAGICKRELFNVDEGTIILDWLINKYGVDGFDIPTAIYEGSIVDENIILKTPMPPEEVDQFIKINRSKAFKGGEQYTIIHTPQDPLTAFAIALVIGVASTLLLMPNIEIPEQPEFIEAKQSPNNSLSGQTNIARPLERIPDIYGRNRVWPDLIMPSYTEYINNVKYVTEYMCIGRGSFDIELVKNGDTLIDDIDGQNYWIYGPSQISPDLKKVVSSDRVDGQELAPTNDVSNIEITGMNVYFYSAAKSFQTLDSNATQFASLGVGNSFTISSSTSNNGTFTLKDYQAILLDGGHEERWRYIISVEEAITEGNDNIDVSSSGGSASSYGPFVIPGNPDEIWIDIVAPKGLQKIDGTARSSVSVDLKASVQELDGNGQPVGSVQIFNFNITANTQDAQYRTFKIKTLTNPGQPHEITFERTSATINDSSIQYYDLIKWDRVSGVEYIEVESFGDVTTIKTVTKATEQATRIQRKELNVVCTRKLLTYDLATGQFNETETATTSFIDAAIHMLTDSKLGNKSISEIDVEALFDIKSAMSSNLIYADYWSNFCYTFSSTKTPVKEELATILNAARCFFYKDGSTIRFVRDDSRPLRSALFNKRNKSPKNSKKTIRYNKPSDYDGIEFQWVDEETGEANLILMPEPNGGTNNQVIKSAGIKNYYQAWNRAKYEYLRIIYRRIGVEETVTKEGLLLILNDRVANVDGTNIRTQDGEVKSINGLVVETFDEIDFEGESTGSVILRDDEGVPSTPISVTERVDGINGFVLSSLPSFSILVRGDQNYQIGTLYNFVSGTDENHLANDYTVQEISPSGEGYVDLKLVNYAEELYAPDTETPT